MLSSELLCVFPAPASSSLVCDPYLLVEVEHSQAFMVPGSYARRTVGRVDPAENERTNQT